MNATNLHICNGDKFTGPFVALINQDLNPSEHLFFVADRVVKYPIPDADNVVRLTDFKSRWRGLLFLVRQMNLSSAIVLHGLFGTMLYILMLQPWLLRKVHWVIWGGDLYIHQSPRRNWRWRVDELIRQFVIGRIGYLQYWIKGDAELAKQWYGARGQYLECLMYTSNVFEPIELPKIEKNHLVVQVGNSADPTNHHEEVFQKLVAIDDGSFHVLCPLSYGDMAYGERIAEEGSRLFGKRFIALREFMSLTEYRQMLATVDIAVFAHRRQQGMGNTISLLGLGKKVYMRDDVTPWKSFQDKGIVVHALDTLSLQPLSFEDMERNCQAVRAHFSREVLVGQLRRIFNGAHEARS